MERKIIVFLAILALSGLALAKEVSVSYNFPLEGGLADVKESVSVADDANAFTALVQLAQEKGIALDISYYDFDSDGVQESAFINSASGLAGSDDFSKYWQFSQNNRPSMSGISAAIPANGESISLDYLEGNLQDAKEWLLDSQKASGAFGDNAFQSSLALSALSLESGVQSAKDRAVAQLLSLQQADSGFGDELYTSVAIIALTANGKPLSEFDMNGKTSIELLAEKQQSDGGFKSGSPKSDVDTTSWAAIAFEQSGAGTPSKDGKTPADFLLSAMHSNGSFGYDKDDATENTGFTEEALVALAAMDHAKDAGIEKSLEWLSGKQNADGCLSDGYLTAMAVIAFNSWGESEKAGKAIECLKTLQNGDGSFGRSSNTSNSLDTGFAIIALEDEEFPLPAAKDSNSPETGETSLNSIVKFTLSIKNSGIVKAKNVTISLDGIPESWILEESSDLEFSEIKSGETKTAEIFVQLKDSGSFIANAVIATAQAKNPFRSNSQAFTVWEAMLEPTLTLEQG